MQQHLHIMLLLAATAVAMATTAADATSLPLSWSPPDCRCVARRAAHLHTVACGLVDGALTPGRTYQIVVGSEMAACGRRWIRLRVDDGPSVAWTTAEALDSCECPQQRREPRPNQPWRSLSAAAVGGRVVKFSRREDTDKARAGPSTKLLHCLCVIESKCNRSIGCHWDVTSDSCGPYQIKLNYWTDASDFAKRKLGGDWKTCTTGPSNMQCSKDTILYYMARYAKRCVGSTREPTDEDFARIHNGGPSGCKIPSTLAYWIKVHACMVK